jgi:hypothetical protein
MINHGDLLAFSKHTIIDAKQCTILVNLEAKLQCLPADFITDMCEGAWRIS